MATTKLRVLLDTNVFVSYLLDPAGRGVASRLVRAVLSGVFILLVPDHLLDELVEVVARKSYLAARIDRAVLDNLLRLMTIHAERIVLSSPPPAPITRDPDDDYLVFAATVGQADYLVTGDDDLLTLAGMAPIAIISPAAFVQVLESGGGESPDAGRIIDMRRGRALAARHKRSGRRTRRPARP